MMNKVILAENVRESSQWIVAAVSAPFVVGRPKALGGKDTAATTESRLTSYGSV